MRYVFAAILAAVSAGCCIVAREWVDDKEIHVIQSGYHHSYTNGMYHGKPPWVYADTICKKCSYTGGPWAGSDIYPATRLVLNHASLMSYSSAASGDYMANIFNIPFYPIVLCQIPVQLCLDTMLLPFDLWNRPTCPEGYRQVD